MDIEWLGGTCFRLASERGVLVTDPPADASRGASRWPTADVIALSRGVAASIGPNAESGEPFVIDGPCEVEVGGIFVIGVPVPGPSEGDGAPRPATAYCVTMDEVAVCLLGWSAGPPGQEEVEILGTVDVLVVPVGSDGLDPDQAVEVVGMLEPLIIVPVRHGRAIPSESEPVDRFLDAMGIPIPEPLVSLTVARTRLPIEPQVVLLSSRA